ncbi:leukocyte elastase inhibitor-like isoform X1 [Sphaeramia orbicularis]|uniref:Leukocyte elastase inhibitor-like n=2 Tax=Sphaeramia orbicularis TaxID=375764 RepID=A0A672YXE4_9TELE|nr:leukocyte elastase inhibitor-like isoform X1 [Sphaeramia orbicularis]XP_029988777.1 leukocyte elastase inhibitor-like isoform X1 [Sphaeramia orbicularis]XP_029988778.1 leukocyte elastase inhibitor-like isoform X1 [Sphaeramia orbicularis]XP_029988779.1 leukocyte elastase inhibitor-like isoform X1 [Sphaeramia orbicularis]
MFSHWMNSVKAVFSGNPISAISSANTDFALELLRTLSQDNPNGNIFFSPLNISFSLAMVYLGAKGNTAAQMAQVLSFSSAEDIHAEFEKLNHIIHMKSGSYTLKLASRLYGETTSNFLSEFLEATQKYYNAELKAVDFIGAPEACRAEINTWVEEQTEKKIKDLLQPGAVNTMTRLALVSAIYFKGNWMHPFCEEDTRESDFEVNQNETRRVEMMFMEKKMPYTRISEHGLQILELPYKDKELSMVILLPQKSTDGSDPLHKLQSMLTREQLEEWTSRRNMSTTTKISITVPKFKLEMSYDMNMPLAKMGMTDVFCEEKADLSRMNGKKGLFLSTMTHRAFVDVNEKGTEAAASVVMYYTLGVEEKIYFTANRPFLFFIRHNKTKSILFLGRFSSP